MEISNLSGKIKRTYKIMVGFVGYLYELKDNVLFVIQVFGNSRQQRYNHYNLRQLMIEHIASSDWQLYLWRAEEDVSGVL